MKINKFCLLFIGLILGFVSCKKEDDGFDVVEIEVRDRDEQQAADMDSLDKYLKAHYYNKSAFVGNSNPKIADLIITKITDEVISSDADSLLINAVGQPKTTVYEDTDYEYFILTLNQGGGTAPTFADDIRFIYEGFTLDDAVFDSALLPVVSDLAPGIPNKSLISGWGKAMPFFNTSESYIIKNDGTVDYVNPGVGVLFLPSGLAYFYQSRTGIPAYSPICFKFELYQTFQNDHDGDGIPSYLEDLNKNGELLSADFTTADDDTDGDSLPNYLDDDDDGDGVPTIDEDINGDGDPTNDIGKNGIANYLDPEETASK
ncbi:peptidylprolyl isomerase [Flavobacteriaceae bacterium SZ-1-7]|uniref:FKBP-type peptidyl-prolyl cis-trans isomerase n=1 Tax=Tamlana sedimenti TaxID=3134126 RepID=UPI00312739FA